MQAYNENGKMIWIDVYVWDGDVDKIVLDGTIIEFQEK